MNKRIFVRKRPAYRGQTERLKERLNTELQLDIAQMDSYIIYDIYDIDEPTYEKAKHSVFSEVVTDEVFEQLTLKEHHYFAYEILPAQYDQRADSAMQCISLLNADAKVVVRSAHLLVFDKPLSNAEMTLVENYLVNPIEARVKDLTVLSFNLDSTPKPLRDLSGFIHADTAGLEAIKSTLSLAMNLPDLTFIQDYFKNQGREPAETELYILDCYWSDHCRHTTFETVLDAIDIQSAQFGEQMQSALADYLSMKKALGSEDKPMTLMDMASIMGKYHLRVLGDKHIEVSEEINACSFFTEVNHNGKAEKWLIQFKNETHNHPTEIEPFGGASTCIGGAIRDPLSGRSYVYQAMRVSGCGNILQPRKDTLPHKLAQIDIANKSALGYSSYGNQIGLATSYVKELYDDSYVAKHMEVGAVVGAVKDGNFKRQSVSCGDIVMVIGGRTGRDGIQGASGSSLVHDNRSLETAASQVQKGNAIEERKLQRLFRNPAVSKLIKKCNDFGAGGVCVAIGELSESIEIHLDKMLLKYEGLNATEIATSESQERMAVVIDPADYDGFIQQCQQENIETAHVATITDKKRLEMFYRGEKVVDIGAEFLSSAGIRQHTTALLQDNLGDNPFVGKVVTKSAILAELSDLNVCSQKPLVEQFDSSIGATTVLLPFSGKYQQTPVQASVQALPTAGNCDTATILSYGFIPAISHYSPFLSAIYAVLESVAKVYAVGGSKDSLYFSFQEYFEKLGNDARKWGKVTQALLGSLYAQQVVGRPSIGGKDSMSGSFNDLNVVETLISFACAPVKVTDVISPELKTAGNKLYYLPVLKADNHYPDVAKTVESYEQLRQWIAAGTVVSAYVQERGSLVSSLIKMALGSGLGFEIDCAHALDFDPASIVIEATQELPLKCLGHVSQKLCVNGIELSFSEVKTAYHQTFEKRYPAVCQQAGQGCENLNQHTDNKRYYPQAVDKVKVVIPVFPGTNCEYDSQRAFSDVGAAVETVIIRNKRTGDIEHSIDDFVSAVEKSHIIMLAGGFSSGDEPDGSAKFIVNFLKNAKVKQAIEKHLQNQRLILGICNGFQALIKSGLLPYGRIVDLSERDLTLYKNDSHRHVSTAALTRVCHNGSPWTQDFQVGDMDEVLFSHGEGKLVGQSVEQFKHLAAFQYCDFDGNASYEQAFNPNGSSYAIEGMISEDGLILGKMGHSERYVDGLYQNMRLRKKQDLFQNAMNYFMKGKKQ